MPQRSAVAQLPEPIRQDLEQKLLKGGFADYAGLADWLTEQGFEISRSAVHRFGQQFESRLQALKLATDQAKAIAAASKDDEGDMNEALIRLVQTKTFEVLVALDEAESEDAPGVDLAKIGRMVADLARSSVQQKKFSDQREREIRKTERESAAERAETAVRSAGMSATSAAELRRKILMGEST